KARLIMSVKYVIEGGHKLRGEITVNGSKNAALPMLAATLLTSEKCTLHRVPMIRDIHVMLDILRHLGATVEIDGNTVSVETPHLVTTQIPDDLASKLRASVLLLGPIIARAGKITLRHPGGCVLGKRPVGVHFDALQALGATFQQDEIKYYGQAAQLIGSRMYLGEASVTATENAMMAAALAHGTTIIEPAACEPHIVSLGKMLNDMGAHVEGLGTHTITIRGAKSLNGTTAHVNADEIETGTLAVAFAITRGSGTIVGVEQENLSSIIYKLNQFGVITEFEGNKLHIRSRETYKPTNIQINIWPLFPTDLQPQMTILATQAEGNSLIHDWMYDRRLLYIDELVKMGGTIMLCDPHRALVTGPTKFSGKTIISPDIRAGMAFVLAGLIASGKTTIEQAHLIERGYENIHERLNSLGAKIERIEN
ncbi:MAG TPA: UDP-N-acetylglucosamine 1-carboxyvinyltransferase, partial [Patescibacteria group bacterium]